MSKIMVVEDDASLREIYGIRIAAEGYEVVSAGDGEEALAMAVREKPNLILSDVMMPKISGFDMLDILRATPETAKIKIIMMTALSGDDQRQRGERLGADRYLVKSQVGIEDVVNVIHEVMGDKNGATPPTPTNDTSSHTVIAVNTQETTPDMDTLAQTLAADVEAQSDPKPTPAAPATPDASANSAGPATPDAPANPTGPATADAPATTATTEATPASPATPTLTTAPAEAAPVASPTDAPAPDATAAPAAPAAPASEANSATPADAVDPVAAPAVDAAPAPAPAVESTATPEMAPTSPDSTAAVQPAADQTGSAA